IPAHRSFCAVPSAVRGRCQVRPSDGEAARFRYCLFYSSRICGLAIREVQFTFDPRKFKIQGPRREPLLGTICMNEINIGRNPLDFIKFAIASSWSAQARLPKINRAIMVATLTLG